MSPDKILIERLQKDINKINLFLEKNLTSRIPLILEINQHILLAGGKRLRALLFILSSRLCGTSGQRTYYFSSIFEYLHAASLLHDDVIDNAALRRGKASANTVWGNSTSVLAGDFLLAKSFSLALETQSFKLLSVLSRASTRMAEGMVLELIHNRNLNLSEDIYREILINKTAILISAACQTGAIWGKATLEEEDALARYGLELGVAFQLIDDLLDYTSTKKFLGKPVGSDFREGKITLPLIYTLKVCSEKDKNKISGMSKKNQLEDKDLQFLLGIIQSHGGFEYTRKNALEAKEKAKEFLLRFKSNQNRQTLIDMADFVVERKN